MKEWEQLDIDEHGVQKAMEKLEPDFNFFCMGRWHTLLGKVLKDATNDTSDWIQYYVYEMNWGRNWKKGTCTLADGTDLPIGTIEDLWDRIQEG